MGRYPHEDGPLKGIREKVSRERAARAMETAHRLREEIAAIPHGLGLEPLTEDEKGLIRRRVGIGLRNQRWW